MVVMPVMAVVAVVPVMAVVTVVVVMAVVTVMATMVVTAVHPVAAAAAHHVTAAATTVAAAVAASFSFSGEESRQADDNCRGKSDDCSALEHVSGSLGCSAEDHSRVRAWLSLKP